jgi:hypothetical protein
MVVRVEELAFRCAVVCHLCNLFTYLLIMATRRLHNDGKVLSILIVDFENMSNFSSAASDSIITDSKVSESESGTSDGEPGQTLESSNWHEVTHFDPGPSKTFDSRY